MQLVYCAQGPEEIGRSGSYTSFEVQANLAGQEVYLMGYIGDDPEPEWAEVALIRTEGSRLVIEPLEERLAERHDHLVRNTRTLFIDCEG